MTRSKGDGRISMTGMDDGGIHGEWYHEKDSLHGKDQSPFGSSAWNHSIYSANIRALVRETKAELENERSKKLKARKKWDSEARGMEFQGQWSVSPATEGLGRNWRCRLLHLIRKLWVILTRTVYISQLHLLALGND